MRPWTAGCVLVLGCAATPPAPDGSGAPIDAALPRDTAIVRDAASADAMGQDVGPPPVTLGDSRDRLWATFTDTPCETWASIDESRRAVFLTITHRFATSRTPDGLSMLDHVTALRLVLGGGASGTTCGGAENNRLFLDVDEALHGWMVDTWNDATSIADDGGSTWLHTRDSAGPHDPFDGSIETDTGLRCSLIFEGADSLPPTAQAHFFLGAAVPVERGSGIMLPADPLLIEIDQDYNCIHDSNPTCRDFEERYRAHHGDFVCDWAPSVCAPVGTGCYRSAMPR